MKQHHVVSHHEPLNCKVDAISFCGFFLSKETMGKPFSVIFSFFKILFLHVTFPTAFLCAILGGLGPYHFLVKGLTIFQTLYGTTPIYHLYLA